MSELSTTPACDRVGGVRFCEAGMLDYMESGSVFEREPLEGLAAAGQLMAYRHDGIWECRDSNKDAVLLNDLWRSGDPSWAVWGA